MYMPKLARFTSRDPLPQNGAVLLGGIPEYFYANNDPIGKNDPSGLKPGGEEFPPGDKPGTFNVSLGNCSPEQLEEGCCCTDLTVSYKPSNADKAKYEKICLPVRVRTRITRTACPDTDNGWHDDTPKDSQSCWPPLVNWTDWPGKAPFAGVPCGVFCAETKILQEFEGCAVGTTKSGKKVVIGCTSWSHQCDVSQEVVTIGGGGIPSYPQCKQCKTTCHIKRTKSKQDIVPENQKHGPFGS